MGFVQPLREKGTVRHGWPLILAARSIAFRRCSSGRFSDWITEIKNSRSRRQGSPGGFVLENPMMRPFDRIMFRQPAFGFAHPP